MKLLRYVIAQRVKEIHAFQTKYLIHLYDNRCSVIMLHSNCAFTQIPKSRKMRKIDGEKDNWVK